MKSEETNGIIFIRFENLREFPFEIVCNKNQADKILDFVFNLLPVKEDQESSK